jgi:hypothetical protein
MLSLVRNQGGHVSDHGRMSWEIELGVHVGGWQPHDSFDVHAFVHDRCLGRRDAVGNQPVTNGGAVGDETIYLRVLPARERVLSDGKLDTPGRHQSRARVRRCDGERHRRHGHGVRVVRVDHVGPELLQNARQAPRGGQVDFVARSQRDQIQPFTHPATQLPVGVQDERGALSKRAKAENGVHDLALATAPRLRRVDVNGEHGAGAHRWSGSFPWVLGTRARTMLHLPELGELQQHRVGVEQRKRQASRSIEDPTAKKIIAHERGRGVHEQIEHARPAAGLVHLPRGERRVVVDPVEMIAQVPIRVVLELVGERASR